MNFKVLDLQLRAILADSTRFNYIEIANLITEWIPEIIRESQEIEESMQFMPNPKERLRCTALFKKKLNNLINHLNNAHGLFREQRTKSAKKEIKKAIKATETLINCVNQCHVSV